MLIALVVITLLGALVTAIIFAVNENTRTSHTLLGVSRALSSAESAAWQSLNSRDWNAALALAPGQYSRTTVAGLTGLVTVTVVRLDSSCFWIGATAQDALPVSKNSGAERRIGITIEVVMDSTGQAKAARVPYRSWTELF